MSKLNIQELVAFGTTSDWDRLFNFVAASVADVAVEIRELPPVNEMEAWQAEELAQLVRFRETVTSLAKQLGLQVS